MAIELMTIGALSGLGMTKLCSIISIILTGARIPLAMLLTHAGMGLDGIWWALSLTSIVKGIVFTLTFRHTSRTKLSKPDRKTLSIPEMINNRFTVGNIHKRFLYLKDIRIFGSFRFTFCSEKKQKYCEYHKQNYHISNLCCYTCCKSIDSCSNSNKNQTDS